MSKVERRALVTISLSADQVSGRVLPALLSDVRAEHPHASVLHVRIMPDIAQLRLIESDVRSLADVRQRLTQRASTYFFGVREPQLVSVARGSNAWVAVAVPVSVHEAVTAAAIEAGFERVHIGPVHASWIAAARRGNGTASFIWAGVRYELTVDRAGRLQAMRRDINRGTPDTDVPAMNHETFGTLEFVSESARVRRAIRNRRLAGGLLVASLLFLAAIPGLRLWDAHRELRHVRYAREALADRLPLAMALRDSLLTMQRQLHLVRRQDAAALRWTEAIESIARALPEAVMLSAVRAEHDSIIVEGVAPDASQIFELLRRSTKFTAVRSNAPVRQMFDSVRGPIEVFSLALTVDSTHTPSAPAQR